MDGYVDGVLFLVVLLQVMSVVCMFWEKVIVVYVYCVQVWICGECYVWYWYDFVVIGCSLYFVVVIVDCEVVQVVVEYKLFFFIEKDVDGVVIDYFVVISGELQIVFDGMVCEVLVVDYDSMCVDDILVGNVLFFDVLMDVCVFVVQVVNVVVVSN